MSERVVACIYVWDCGRSVVTRGAVVESDADITQGLWGSKHTHVHTNNPHTLSLTHTHSLSHTQIHTRTYKQHIQVKDNVVNAEGYIEVPPIQFKVT